MKKIDANFDYVEDKKMNVVPYADAARDAGVSRQAIFNLKTSHDEHRRNYPFFCHDPTTGQPGVDIDHPYWTSYCQKQAAKKRRFSSEAEMIAFYKDAAVTDDDYDPDEANKSADPLILIQAIGEAAIQFFGDSENRTMFLKLVEDIYESISNEIEEEEN